VLAFALSDGVRALAPRGVLRPVFGALEERAPTRARRDRRVAHEYRTPAAVAEAAQRRARGPVDERVERARVYVARDGARRRQRERRRWRARAARAARREPVDPRGLQRRVRKR